jgi:hypothetical protein
MIKIELRHTPQMHCRKIVNYFFAMISIPAIILMKTYDAMEAGYWKLNDCISICIQKKVHLYIPIALLIMITCYMCFEILYIDERQMRAEISDLYEKWYLEPDVYKKILLEYSTYRRRIAADILYKEHGIDFVIACYRDMKEYIPKNVYIIETRRA